MRAIPWRVLAILGWAIVLLGAGAAGAMFLPGFLRPPAVTVTPQPAPTPSPAATRVPTPIPAPVAIPTPTKANFIVVSADWRNCYHSERAQVAPICLGHGVFQNTGGSSGSAAVTFGVPGQDWNCTAVIPSTPPQGVSEASCDLGYTGENYYNVHGGAPSVTVANP